MNTQAFLDDVRDDIKAYIIANSTYMAAGSGTTTPTTSQTSLATEETRKARQEYTEDTNTVTVSLFLGTADSNGDTLTEVGVFNASSAGDMMMREIFPAISKTSTVDIWIDVEQEVDVTQ